MSQDLYTLDPATGWLVEAEKISSPNFNLRPNDTVSLLVIHNISLPPGQFGTQMVDALFTNSLPIEAHPYFAQLEGLKVSAHFLIERSGHLKQFVSCHHRAWHAGVSRFAQQENCNDFSIGIELEGTDTTEYQQVQYKVLNSLIKTLQKHYPLITNQRICGHSDIAPGRKTDPGPAFDWAKITV